MARQWVRKELWIQGMMLEASAARLEGALNGLAGVRDAKASFPDEKVWFFYDPGEVKLRAILKAIAAIGYIASEKPPQPAPANRPAAGSPAPAGSGRASGDGSPTLVRKVLRIDGMSCTNCEMRIENRLKKAEGIREARVSYASGTAKVGYDPRITDMSRIVGLIEKLDYRVADNPDNRGTKDGKRARSGDKLPINQLLGVGIILLAGYLVIKNTVGFDFVPNISQNMGFGILFVIGLITSVHCVAMCGGINLSQSVSYKFSDKEKENRLAKLKPSVMYNAGRVLSYTALGGIVGALGSVVSFSGTARGVVSILAGVFMLIMGLNMLGIFPWLRHLMPHMPKVFARKFRSGGKHGPFFVGLFNGLMPCGPLQAMQIYALGTGSPVKGALSMLVFSLGTVPLMFGFGAISSFLSSRFTHKMMRVSAALVIILGVVMLNRGFSLSGISLTGAFTAKAAGAGAVATVKGGEQDVTTTLQAGGYTPISVQKGIPVKWIIKADASAINGCNGTVTVPRYNIVKRLQPGDNEIDFTPRQTGTITYTCSMGMISSTISVVDDVANVKAAGQPSSSADGVGVAKISGNEQEVTVTVGSGGYSPSILVLQKGVPAKISFKTGPLTSCNSTVVFPELGGELDLTSRTETPLFTPPDSAFTFRCGMGMLSGYVEVVDDLGRIDLDQIRQNAQGYISSGGGMACCQ